MLKPDETKSSLCDLQVSNRLRLIEIECLNYFLTALTSFFAQMADGSGMAEGGSVLDFMSMKSYPDMSLDISMLNSLGECFSLSVSALSLE